MTSIKKSLEEAVLAVQLLQKESHQAFIRALSQLLLQTFDQGNKVLLAGNGGSLCDAAHFAEELTGFFRSREREALPAIVLNDPGHLTCVSNDIGFEHVFSRGVQALGKKEDLLILLTTSGHSRNLVAAYESARIKEMKVVCFLGKDGGSLRGLGDLELVIEGFAHSDRIQEAHMAAIHIAIEQLEEQLISRQLVNV